jgi:Protein of unknown function (DUF1759)
MPESKGENSASATRIKRATLQINIISKRIGKIKEAIGIFNRNENDEFFLEEKQSALRTAHRQYHVHVAELFELAAKEICDTYEEDILNLEECVDEINSDIRRLLKGLKGTHQPPPERQNDPKSRIRLPEIPISTFNGEYDEWVFFRERFSALISEHPTLTDVEKHIYLRSALQGEAKQLETSNDTYQSLWIAL